ncbi:MAG: N-acetylmuramoyl-L-alanine amidase family protein [Anaerolineae bacterium]
MSRLPHTLTAAMLAGVMFAQSLVLPLRPQGSLAGQAPKPATTAAPAAMNVSAAPAAEQAAPAPAIEKGKTIFIDAGHGGWDPGAVHKGPDGREDQLEKDAALVVAQKLYNMLTADGYHVVLSRSSDAALTPNRSTPEELQARIDMANKADADLFISVHFNGSENKALRGTEVYYNADRPFSADNQRLAEQVQAALVSNLRQAGYDTEDRGAKTDAPAGGFALLAPANLARPTRMPAIIGEPLFITNDQDAAALSQDSIREALARGYFQGIKAYFGDTQ